MAYDPETCAGVARYLADIEVIDEAEARRIEEGLEAFRGGTTAPVGGPRPGEATEAMTGPGVPGDDGPSLEVTGSIGRTLGCEPGVDLEPDPLPDLEEQRERYIPGEVLGRCGMGEVREATDRDLRRRVALKRLLADDPELRERFLEEARPPRADRGCPDLVRPGPPARSPGGPGEDR